MATDKQHWSFLLQERLASLEHEQWSHWAGSILQSEQISEERKARWNDLILKAYKDLTEEEKESDREWARKAMKIISVFSLERKAALEAEKLENQRRQNAEGDKGEQGGESNG